MDVDDASAPPRCGVCGHCHEQGSKCPVCGHLGKSRVFQCFKNKSSAYAFSIQRFDCFSQTTGANGDGRALDRENLGLWTFVKILRSRIFPGMPNELPDDSASRHFVALVGDGPMGVARWRPASEESGSQVVVIEHFGVLEAKRRQGYGKQFLQTIVEDIHETFASEPTRPQALVAYVPQTDSFTSMKLFQSLGFQPAAQVQMVEDSSFLRMRMAWGCNRS